VDGSRPITDWGSRPGTLRVTIGFRDALRAWYECTLMPRSARTEPASHRRETGDDVRAYLPDPPMSGHVVLPASEETQSEWPALVLWLAGN